MKNKKQKSVFVICFIKSTDDVMYERMKAYKQKLEDQEYKVHLLSLDANPEIDKYEFCFKNMKAIVAADEVHIFFHPKSYDVYFYLGMTFLAGHLDKKKIIKVIENDERVNEFGQIKLLLEKSFGQMLYDWEHKQNREFVCNEN